MEEWEGAWDCSVKELNDRNAINTKQHEFIENGPNLAP